MADLEQVLRRGRGYNEGSAKIRHQQDVSYDFDWGI